MKNSCLTALCALALSSTAAFAQVELLSAEQIVDVESSFTLDFGEFGGKTIAGVTNTEFEVQLDKSGKFARFLNYSQDVGSIKLPGGLETGAIKIAIVESLGGSYDGKTINTSDIYSIEFEGDLAAFGLKSPVELPSDTVATVEFDSNNTGIITMDWVGQGALGNPQKPDAPIPFEYTCHVEAKFSIQRARGAASQLCGSFDLASLFALAVPLAALKLRSRRRKLR